MAELRKEVYSRELQKRLFPSNTFILRSYKEKIAADAIAIKIPQAGNVPGAIVGQPKQLPLAISSVTDSQKSINVYPVIAPPVLIDSESEVATDYNKRAEYQSQQADSIMTAIANITAIEWAPDVATFKVVTTGTARATSLTGLTGTRKALTKTDFIKAKLLLEKNLGENMGKITALLTYDAYEDILNDANFTDYDKLGLTSKLIEGVVGKFMGVEIMKRNNDKNHIGVTYTSAKAKKAYGAAAAAGDLPANLFWSDKFVAHVSSGISADVNGGPGLVGGKVIESWLRFGAGKKREDEKGVVVVLEAAG